jgi:hypothetical protein
MGVAILLWLFAAGYHLHAKEPAELHDLYKHSFAKYQLQRETLQNVLVRQNAVQVPLQERAPGMAAKQKSKGRAFLQSLLLPGWGQHYAESRGMTKVFIAAEVALWGSYLGFKLNSDWKESDYRDLAASHAGVDLNGKTAGYFFDIGIYDNLADYNQASLRDRDVRALYPDTEEYQWDWDSTENRIRFDGLRIKSDEANNNANLTIALIFVNHLVSALQSTLAVHKFNERLQQSGIGMHIDMNSHPLDRYLRVNLVKSF